MSTVTRRILVAAVFAFAPAARAAVPGIPVPAVALPGEDLRPEIARSVDLAGWKLETIPGCRGVLDEFRDLRGRALSENLAATGLGPAAYLRSLLLTNGGRHPLCRTTAHAVTVPFGDTVAVCEDSFLSVQRRNASRAANLLIHEMLHTLGLGENGRHPSSLEITSRVGARCGS